jgi:hypothetical protein
MGQYRIVHSEPDGDSVHFISGNADAFTSGATITTLADLTDRLVIMPKLFRRLAEYFALSVGSVSLDGFAAFMASHDDRLYVISDAHAPGFDNVITVAGQTVNLDKEITLTSGGCPGLQAGEESGAPRGVADILQL